MVAAASAHAIAAVFFAAFLRRRAQRLEIEAVGRGAWLMFALASAVLPLVGPLALGALIARLARLDDSADAALAHAALTPDLDAPFVASTAATDIGAASFEARLRFNPRSRRAVAPAVLATRRLHNPADATRLLRLALRDQSEEVRLLAHALLEDRERRAYDAVDQLTRELAAAPADRRGPIACLLAEASLDLCTAGLVSGELESFTLRRARALMEDARAAAPIRASASAALLFGRVLLRQGESRDARAAFEESRRLGAPDPLTAPYLRGDHVPDPRGRDFIGAAGVTSAAAEAPDFPRLAGDGVADVGLLLEGTYPYVSGGVSTWVHEIITGFPELTFGICFLGATPETYGDVKYRLPANVVHVEVHHLMASRPPPRPRAGPGRSTSSAISARSRGCTRRCARARRRRPRSSTRWPRSTATTGCRCTTSFTTIASSPSFARNTTRTSRRRRSSTTSGPCARCTCRCSSWRRSRDRCRAFAPCTRCRPATPAPSARSFIAGRRPAAHPHRARHLHEGAHDRSAHEAEWIKDDAGDASSTQRRVGVLSPALDPLLRGAGRMRATPPRTRSSRSTTATAQRQIADGARARAHAA